MALILGLRPLLGPAACKFPIGCTQFAVETLKTKPLLPALQDIVNRLLQCRP